MKKKWLAVIGAVILVTAIATIAFAANPIKLIVNGQEIKPDVPPQLINERTMVPIRWVAEALGADVQRKRSGEAGAAKINAELLQRLRAIELEQPETIVNDLNRERVKQFLEQNQLRSIQDIRSF